MTKYICCNRIKLGNDQRGMEKNSTRRSNFKHQEDIYLLDIGSLLKKQTAAPLISGQILFLQVSTQTSTARPEASRNSRRSEVRAKNLEGDKNGIDT